VNVRGRALARVATIGTLGNAPALAGEELESLHATGVLARELGGLDRLKGFLAQVNVNISVLSPTLLEGIKVQMPMLSRFPMVTLWQQVAQPVRERLSGAAGRLVLLTALDAAVKRSIRGYLASKYPGEGFADMVRARSEAGLDGPMITARLKETVNGVEQVAQDLVGALGSISRREWLLNLFEGRDLLTPGDLLPHLQREASSALQKRAAQNYGKSMAVFLRGYGNTSHVQDVEGEATGSLALLENRNINPWKGLNAAEQGIGVDAAKTFALAYFDWLMGIKQARELVNQRERVRTQRLHDDSSSARSMNQWG